MGDLPRVQADPCVWYSTAMTPYRALAEGPESPGRGKAVVLPFRPVVKNGADDQRNAEWDRLLRLACEAWSWRDPDSLNAVLDCIAGLEVRIAREWSA